MCEISSNLCNVKYTDVNLRLGGFRRTLIYTRVSMCFSPRYSLQGRSPALPAPLNAVK